jgi:predicted flap endonuclease-1-like 5' DNA nuclease
MALNMNEINGITPELVEALKAAGLTNSDKLLAAVAQPKDRAELAAKLGVDVRELLELGNRADLGRIRGIGVVYSDLLEFAGVDTVAELATRKPENLFKKIMDVAAEHTVKRTPTAEDVVSWVDQAKNLDRGIFY